MGRHHQQQTRLHGSRWFHWTRLGMLLAVVAADADYPTKSGIHHWVDPATPVDQFEYTSSRGRTWELVMSDEFNTPKRSFKPGHDHIWTSLEQPDGVNGALEVYSHSMTSTACDADSDTCYLFLKVQDEETNVSVFNAFEHPPRYETATFFYRAAMLQSWNKFCFQGGMLEVRAQLPGAVEASSGNPDLAAGPSTRVHNKQFYPTWPGIWLMGNLGRAIFSSSTSRMWPFSYDRCDPELFDPANQRISACDRSPGYGLNPNQGRGAPEIDLLEGGGTMISSSLQIAPGMPADYRLFPADKKIDEKNIYCVYTYNCETPGANLIDVPTAYFEEERGHKSWYQGLRYAANNMCAPDNAQIQNYDVVAKSVAAGVKENNCSVATCPASLDVNNDLDFVDGDSDGPRWGINANGTCFPVMNSYMGSYLCDPDNSHHECIEPRNDSTPVSNVMEPFNYQMDAISANWPIHLGGYTDYLVYQLEWVTGPSGYVRWQLDENVIFEVTAESIEKVPQDADASNPIKLMIEEPMSIIFNVALSRSWGVSPPNPGYPCRGDGLNDETNHICDSFPMYMKIDYIRLYQDRGDDLDEGSLMQIGCDPPSHPTRRWIMGHLDDYQNEDNPVVSVAGRAFCTVDDDCTVSKEGGTKSLVTGKCVSSRCVCAYPTSWGGPRCATAMNELTSVDPSDVLTTGGYGPTMSLSMLVALLSVALTFASVYHAAQKARRLAIEALRSDNAKMKTAPTPVGQSSVSEFSDSIVSSVDFSRGVLL